MKTCKDKACIKWKDLDTIVHALKSDIVVINGVELTTRQVGVKTDIEAVDPIIASLNKLRWRLMDRVQQLNDVVNENNKE